MPSNPADLLRAHVREHNLSVFAASGAAVVVATVGWFVIFAAGYWVAMIAVAAKGIEARPDSYPHYFFLSAGGVTFLAFLEVLIFPHEHARDERGRLAQLWDILLFIPRITVATIQNFTAWAYLPSPALPYAVRLVGRLRVEPSVPLQELAWDIPHPYLRRRVLATFEITQLTDIRSEHGQLIIRWSALAPAALRFAHPEQATPDIPHAKVVEKRESLPAPPPPALDDRYQL